jgi:alcohol dehydrogenase (NADP+)
MFFTSRLLPLSTLVSFSKARNNLTTTACHAINMLPDYPIGLGTYQITPDQVPIAISSAVRLGYRRLDCAPVYFNEDKIGDALQEEFKKGLDRKDLYIVSKLASPFHRQEHVKIGLQKTLSDLRLDYLDLFLIHWPTAFHYVDIANMNQRGYPDEEIDESDGGKRIDPTVSVHETWGAMEEMVDQGLVRSIGVSNFPVSLLHELMTRSRIPPAVNQVELHPYLQQTNLLDYCQKRGVHLQAYSPLGTPGAKEADEPSILTDPVLGKIAEKHNVTVAQVCIAWALQRGTSVVAKSASPVRQEENLKAAKEPLTLTPDEMMEIALLDRGYRFFRPEEWWGSMGMAVFD